LKPIYTRRAQLKDERINAYTLPGGQADNVVLSLCRDRAGHLWVGAASGLRRFEAGSFSAENLSPDLQSTAISSIFQDQEGNVWFGTGKGLFRSSQGGFESYGAKDGLPSDGVTAIYQDAEGSLWVGTNEGLCRLKDFRFKVYTAKDGLAGDIVWAIYEDTTGSIWLSTSSGLSRFKDGNFTNYGPKNGLPANYIPSITEDTAGNLWFGTAGGGAVKFKDGQFTALTKKNGLSGDNIAAVHADRAGNLWFATYGFGVNLLRNGQITVYTTQDGLASDYVRAIFEDRAGNIRVGTKNGGVSRFDNGRFTTWITNEGTSNFATSFYEDSSGALWVNTLDEGLSRFKDGKIVNIIKKNGLFDNMAFEMLPDGDDGGGSLWMSCNRGIYRVSQRELNDFADGRAQSVTSFSYGVADGMLDQECNAASPSAFKTRDGRLWFATVKGVVVIDPRNHNTQPPNVIIERAIIDRQTLPVPEAIKIEPEQDKLEIQYTALSWDRPQQIRFKYQLVGLEDDWTDVGTRRAAYYTHLPPGEYTFRVIADNGEGVWNMEGKSLRVLVLPPFYRTWWFIALLALAFVGLVVFVNRLRIRQLTRARIVQEEFSRRLLSSQEQERKRIAAELHDSLGQNLLVIKNRAMMGLVPQDLPGSSREQLDEISTLSSQAIEEVREIAYNLRPYQIDRLGLSRAVEAMIKKVAVASGIRFTTEIEQLKGVLAKDAEISVYRVVQECVNNIVKHSEATEANVEMKRDGLNFLHIIVKDNGKGFAVEQTLSPESGKHGFGLVGMPERVRLLGGMYDIQSSPGKGTIISVTLTIENTPDEKRN
jgi:signal transduction histidine kinase/ligand-binding sensor domain-containing protein